MTGTVLNWKQRGISSRCICSSNKSSLFSFPLTKCTSITSSRTDYRKVWSLLVLPCPDLLQWGQMVHWTPDQTVWVEPWLCVVFLGKKDTSLSLCLYSPRSCSLYATRGKQFSLSLTHSLIPCPSWDIRPQSYHAPEPCLVLWPVLHNNDIFGFLKSVYEPKGPS